MSTGPVAQVARISIAPVKGTRLQEVERVALRPGGVVEDRRFFIVDGRDRMVNGKLLGALNAVVAGYDHAARELTLSFPDGRRVRGAVRTAGEVRARFYSRMRGARLVEGPWAQALSEHLDQPVRLVEAEEAGTAVDRGSGGAVSLVSRASLQRLAGEAEVQDIDSRRFRMLLEVDGVAAHAEDTWVRRTVRVGETRLRFAGHVGRCLITSRDPETGEVDLPTLDVLAGYRGEVAATEPLPFGIYGEVLEPGVVAVGDGVSVE